MRSLQYEFPIKHFVLGIDLYHHVFFMLFEKLNLALFKKMQNQSQYTGGTPQRWHSSLGLHYCHTAVRTNVIVVTIATSVTSAVVTAL